MTRRGTHALAVTALVFGALLLRALMSSPAAVASSAHLWLMTAAIMAFITIISLPHSLRSPTTAPATAVSTPGCCQRGWRGPIHASVPARERGQREPEPAL